MLTLLATAALAVPQGPESRPTSRPQRPPSDSERRVEAEWADDAPGKQVVVDPRSGLEFKWLPMVGGVYGKPADVAGRVRDEDLVIGLVVDDRAFAYPINMLGGPQREIVNDEYGGQPFCVNW